MKELYANLFTFSIIIIIISSIIIIIIIVKPAQGCMIDLGILHAPAWPDLRIRIRH